LNIHKFKLLNTLTTTAELLSRSTVEGWPAEEPAECLKVIRQLIDHLFDSGIPLPEYWEIQFTVTGPVQEIAHANGWHIAYMILAQEWYKNYLYLKQNTGNLEHE